MAEIRLRDIPMSTYGILPAVGSKAPNFMATKPDLSTVELDQFMGQPVLINIYPSIDTSVCFNSVKKFSDGVAGNENLLVMCISMDLPFALRRVVDGERINNILFLSDYRNREFGELYGLTIAEGPIAGMLARAVILLDSHHTVLYHELVVDQSQPPNYHAALDAANGFFKETAK